MIVPYLKNKKIDFKEIESILSESISINQFTNNGPIKQKLEKRLEELLSIDKNKRIICVSSGTAALHVILLYLEYINEEPLKFYTPAYNFPSVLTNTANIHLENDRSIDVENDGYIIPNLFGTNCLKDIKERIVIYDNASSPLTRINGKNICNYGDYSFGSLHQTKFLGFGEGGFLICLKEEYEMINSLTNFGYNNNRIHKKQSSNFKISDVSAAFILHNINNYDIQKHVKIQKYLIQEINSIEGLQVFNYSEDDIVYGNFPVLFTKPIDNKYFRDLGIESNKYYLPLSDNKELYKSAWDTYDRIINFPLYDSLTDYQVEFMVKIIKNAI